MKAVCYVRLVVNRLVGLRRSLVRYRLLTGPDDAAFCHRVSEALALGYELYGSPAGGGRLMEGSAGYEDEGER